VLHTFEGPDGANPDSVLLFDSRGNLYGTTDNGGLKPEQVAGQQEVEDLAAAVRQRFEAEGPAGVQRIELGAILAGTDDLGAGWHREMIAFHVIDDAEFVIGDRPEQTTGT
jgi:hypothetical protein